MLISKYIPSIYIYSLVSTKLRISLKFASNNKKCSTQCQITKYVLCLNIYNSRFSNLIDFVSFYTLAEGIITKDIICYKLAKGILISVRSLQRSEEDVSVPIKYS